jgi:hypothetical protein
MNCKGARKINDVSASSIDLYIIKIRVRYNTVFKVAMNLKRTKHELK